MKTKLLNAIQSELTKTFPEMLELNFGCELQESTGMIAILGGETIYIYPKHYEYYDISEVQHHIDLGETKILGRPALITDVLRYLGYRYLLQGDGSVIYCRNYSYKDDAEIECVFDMGAPHPKDQSEETLTKVARLMNIEL